MEPPPKKRRLLIVDSEIGEGTPAPPVVEQKVTSLEPVFHLVTLSDDTLSSLGAVHATIQRYVIDMAKYYNHYDEVEDRIWLKLDELLVSKTGAEATEKVRRLRDSISMYFSSLWNKKKIAGPDTPENLERQAKTAERVANLHIDKGNDEAAKKQFEKAKSIRAKIK